MALLVGKGSTAEERRLRKNCMAALIEHGFNLLFVVIALGYIVVVVLAFMHCDKWVALGGIGFLTPYFIMMLKMVLDLKGVYIEDANLPAGKMSIPDVSSLDCNISGNVPAGKV